MSEKLTSEDIPEEIIQELASYVGELIVSRLDQEDFNGSLPLNELVDACQEKFPQLEEDVIIFFIQSVVQEVLGEAGLEGEEFFGEDLFGGFDFEGEDGLGFDFGAAEATEEEKKE